MKSNLRCDIDWVEITDDIVFIRDLNQGRMSVTNDAENVYHWIHRIAYPGRRVVYCDSTGQWDEIIEVPGAHAGDWRIAFRPWNGRVWDILSK